MVQYDRTIPPGGVGKITLEVNTTGLQGKTTKNAQVTSNDPKQRHSRIYLSMHVRTHILVEPGPKILLRGIVGEDIRRVVHIRAADNRPMEISKITTTLGSAVDYKVSSKEAGKQYDLEVVSKSTGKKTASGFITLHTNHPEKKELKLRVFVRVRPELQVWPGRIVLQERVGAEGKAMVNKRLLTIRNNRSKNFQIRELSYNQEYFRVRSLAKVDKPANRYQFEVEALTDRLPAGRVEFHDTLIIKTDGSRTKELKVPMTIRLRK